MHTDTAQENQQPLKTYLIILKNQQNKPDFRGGRSYVARTRLIDGYPLSAKLMQTLVTTLCTRVIK